MNSELKKNRIILGIDPGLNTTGFGIIVESGSNIRYVTSGIIETKKGEELGKRLAYIYDGIKELIKEYKPIEIAMEEVFINVNPESSKKLIMARTAAYLACCNLGYVVNEYSPNTVKRNVTGNGHATKEQVYTMIQKIFSTKIDRGKTSDSMDAIGVALCHLFCS